MRIVRSRSRAAGRLALLAVLVLSLPAGADEVPTADTLLDEFGFTAEQKERIFSGEIVTSEAVNDSSERELAIRMAFLVRQPTSAVVDNFFAQADLSADPDVTAWGRIDGPGTLEDFAKLSLTPNTDASVKSYLAAEPGSTLNLSQEEIAAFHRLGSRGGEPRAPVEAELRRQLLARYQAYREKGLAGIAPYQRGDGPYQPSEDIARAVRAYSATGRHAPAMRRTLLEYPAYRAPGLKEQFSWVNYRIDNLPTLVLGHQLALDIGGGTYAAASRHYYVSRSHNITEAHGALVPAQEGSIVFYANRTSTDQAAGFGSSARHKLGRKIMGKQIAAIYERVRP
jgi:hypothetical protein